MSYSVYLNIVQQYFNITMRHSGAHWYVVIFIYINLKFSSSFKYVLFDIVITHTKNNKINDLLP